MFFCNTRKKAAELLGCIFFLYFCVRAGDKKNLGFAFFLVLFLFHYFLHFSFGIRSHGRTMIR